MPQSLRVFTKKILISKPQIQDHQNYFYDHGRNVKIWNAKVYVKRNPHCIVFSSQLVMMKNKTKVDDAETKVDDAETGNKELMFKIVSGSTMQQPLWPHPPGGSCTLCG